MNTATIEKAMSKRGNAIGFTAAGETVCAQYSKQCGGIWRVWIEGESNWASKLGFTKKGEAAAYASTLICDTQTNLLKWW